MIIKTVGDLKKVLSSFDDDFILDVAMMKRLPIEEILKSKYPYPYYSTDATLEYHDVSWSDKLVCFGVYENEE